MRIQSDPVYGLRKTHSCFSYSCVNQEIVGHGISGFLASNVNDLVAKLIQLRDNDSLRQEMGYAGRRKVEEHYCIQVTALL